jgi:hypothetical protein
LYVFAFFWLLLPLLALKSLAPCIKWRSSVVFVE